MNWWCYAISSHGNETSNVLNALDQSCYIHYSITRDKVLFFSWRLRPCPRSRSQPRGCRVRWCRSSSFCRDSEAVCTFCEAAARLFSLLLAQQAFDVHQLQRRPLVGFYDTSEWGWIQKHGRYPAIFRNFFRHEKLFPKWFLINVTTLRCNYCSCASHESNISRTSQALIFYKVAWLCLL